MNNSKKFLKAHEIARATRQEVGDYRIAFKLAMLELNSQPTKIEKVKKTLKSVFCVVKKSAKFVAKIDFFEMLAFIFTILMVIVIFGGISWLTGYCCIYDHAMGNPKSAMVEGVLTIGGITTLLTILHMLLAEFSFETSFLKV